MVLVNKFTLASVIGAIHTINHQDASKFFSYIKEKISYGNIVAVESPVNLERILAEMHDCKDPRYRFLYETCTLLQKSGAQVKTVEDQRAYKLQARRQFWLMFEGREALLNDWIYQKLTVYRSISLLKLAKQENSDFLITGLIHAYHLQRMGYPHVTLLSELSEKSRQLEDKVVSKYGINLQNVFK